MEYKRHNQEARRPMTLSRKYYDRFAGSQAKAIILLCSFVSAYGWYFFELPSPWLLLQTIVVICTFVGGYVYGVIAALIAAFYSFYYFSVPGKLFTFTAENLFLIIMLFASISVIIGLVGYLRNIISITTEELIIQTKETEQVKRILSHIIDIDGLTQVPNRRSFDRVSETEIERCRRYGSPLSIAVINIDFFKNYNDTYGHLQGDDCLKQVAHAIAASTTRPGDLVARHEAEQFAVILPSTDQSGAARVCERIREAVQALRIPHESSKVHPCVTVSIGVVTVIPTEESWTPQVLVKMAALAVQKAKQTGRNKVVPYEG